MSGEALPVPRNLERFPDLHPPFDRTGAVVEASVVRVTPRYVTIRPENGR